MININESFDWNPSKLPEMSILEEALRCRICRDLMQTPLITGCCHTFCSLCIRRCLSEKQQCPLCRQPEQENRLRRNISIEEVIEIFERIRPGLMALANPLSNTEVSREINTEIKSPDINSIPTIVKCPVCYQSVDFDKIHMHLDVCLNQKSSSCIQTVISPKTEPHMYSRLPKLNYALLSESKLRSELKSLGLKISGDKAMLQRRHTEWINLWNANIDSKTPVSKRILLEKLDAWDQMQLKTTSMKNISDKNWMQTYKTDFDNLIENARQSKKRKTDTSPKNEPPETQ
ncbi:DNA repair protein rad18 [Pneumocystis carinii B80]|uniref:Postreplication repair E3 ubiquitin-protein ligase RAD18 n=1 Tax=Pneumocystis carinii (strain B80) TaxID=1408658 RepID=A0A0W4ZG20_PNEC8|nr:DNA repair protein rad18 [Pneumocystis carinii B80]KTW27314.1 DNA repair protein rad18 [Pneumocystis carinii B80]